MIWPGGSDLSFKRLPLILSLELIAEIYSQLQIQRKTCDWGGIRTRYLRNTSWGPDHYAELPHFSKDLVWDIRLFSLLH